MNEHEFESITGHSPDNDDLERANCNKTGEPGHLFCGVCKTCGMPRFLSCKHVREEFGH